MDDRNKTQSRVRVRPAGAVDAGQRRALARLGLARAGAYAPPTLLALRSPIREIDSPERIVFAA